MGTELVKSYGNLQQELEDAKHSLVSLNENIKKIMVVGRSTRSERHKTVHESRRNEEPSKNKRRSKDSKSVFNRLSAVPARHTDEDIRPRLNSRVIRELPSREDIVTAQGPDSESRARNRRMFGSLLGTLQKFCQEETRLKQKEDKKAQIEKKLELQEREERETLKKERETLFSDRRKKQHEIKLLEIKMSRLKDFETWETSTRCLKTHIRSKTKPYIYFRPREFNKKTKEMLIDSQKTIEELIESKRSALNQELAELQNSTKTTEDINDEVNDDNGETSFNEIDTKYSVETRSTDESRDKFNSDGRSWSGKYDGDSKENNIKNNNEHLVCSSIVVVNKSNAENKRQ